MHVFIMHKFELVLQALALRYNSVVANPKMFSMRVHVLDMPMFTAINNDYYSLKADMGTSST